MLNDRLTALRKVLISLHGYVLIRTFQKQKTQNESSISKSVKKMIISFFSIAIHKVFFPNDFEISIFEFLSKREKLLHVR